MAERVLKSAISSSKSDLGPYFDEYKRFLVADKAEVLQAQDDFFRAMHNADFDVMRTLWLDSNETLCLPPGSDFFYTGTENVLAYWASALTTPRPYITIRNVKLNWQGDVAIVSCLMDSGRPQRRSGGAKQGQGARSREVHVTNIFVRRAGSDVYKLSAHIASTSAASQGPQQLAYLQETYTDPLRAKKRSSRGGGMGVGMMGFDGSFGGGQGMGGPVTIEALLQQLADPDGAGQSGSFSDDGDEYSNDDEEEGEDEEDNGQGEFYGGGDENGPRNGFFDEQEDDSFFRDQLHSSFGQGPGGGGSVQSDVRGNRGGSGPRVFILDNSSGKLKQVGGSKDSGSDRDGGDGDGDEEEEEGEDEDEQEERLSRVLASRTLDTIRFLADKGSISQSLCRGLTAEVIKSVAKGRYSKAEVAFSLVIGAGMPEDELDKEGALEETFDPASVPYEELAEFADILYLL